MAGGINLSDEAQEVRMAAADREEECLSHSRREWLNCTRIASSPDSALRFPLQALPGFGWRAWESKQCSRPPLHAPLTSQVSEGNGHPQNMRCGQQRGSILPVSTQAAKQKRIPAHAPHHRTACSDSRLTCTRVCARVQVDRLPCTRAQTQARTHLCSPPGVGINLDGDTGFSRSTTSLPFHQRTRCTHGAAPTPMCRSLASCRSSMLSNASSSTMPGPCSWYQRG